MINEAELHKYSKEELAYLRSKINSIIELKIEKDNKLITNDIEKEITADLRKRYKKLCKNVKTRRYKKWTLKKLKMRFLD